jgi:hypothetical protein
MAFCRHASAAEGDPLEEAQRLKASAIEHVKRSRAPNADEQQELKSAVALLERARDLLADIGEPSPEVESELQDVTSLLYWCRKMTAVQVAPPTKMKEKAEGGRHRGRKKSRSTLAREGFWAAVEYAKQNEDRPLLVAARFLEVAEQFKGTEWGRKAKTLADGYEERLKQEEKEVAPEPPPLAEARAVSEEERASLIAALAEELVKDAADGTERLAACDRFLATLPGDVLAEEVASLRRVFGVGSLAAMAAEAKAHFERFPDGYFGPQLASLRKAIEMETALGALERVLKSRASAEEKAKACREFHRRFRSGPLHIQVRVLERVYLSDEDRDRLAAWVLYRQAFPGGFMRVHAEAFFLKSEALVVREMEKALSADRPLRARMLGKVYLSMFRGKPLAREIVSLLSVLKERAGPKRAAAAEGFLERHADGEFSPAVQDMVDRWRSASEKDAYRRFVTGVSTVQTDSERKLACDEFLAAYPEGDHAAEVATIGTVFGMKPTTQRLAAADRYLEGHPDGRFRQLVSEVRAQLSRQREEDLYFAVEDELASSRAGITSRLAACNAYLAGAPEGPHADEVRAAREKVLVALEEESREYDRYQSAAAEAASPGEAVRVYDKFLRKYPGGLHVHRALAQKAVLLARLRAERAAETFMKLAADLKRTDLSNVEKADACLAFLREHRPDPTLRASVLKALRGYARTELGPHAAPVRAAVVEPGAEYLITIDADRKLGNSGVWFWALPDMELEVVYRIRGGFTARSAAVLSDGDRLVIGEDNGSAMVWDLEDDEVTGRFRLSASPLGSVVPLRGAAKMVTASRDDPKARTWDLSSWTPSDETFVCPGGCSAATATRSGDIIALGGTDGRIIVYDAGGGEPLWTATGAFAGKVDGLAFSTNRAYLVATCGAEGRVRCWNTFTGTRVWESEETSRSVAPVGSGYVLSNANLRYASNGKVVAEIGADGPVAVSRDAQFAFVGEGKAGSVWYLPALLAY